MVSDSGKTRIIGDPDDEGRNNDELELDLDDDAVQMVEDDQMNWFKPVEPMTVDMEVTAYSPDGGRDFDQHPCPQVEGVLLRRAGDIGPGERMGITAGQVKLARLLKKADPKVGQRMVVKYVGVVKVAGGTLKDFQIGVGPLKPKAPTQSEKPPF